MSDATGLTGLEGSIGGLGAQPLTSVKTGMDIDVRPVTRLSESFKTLRESIKGVREEMAQLRKEADQTASSVGKVSSSSTKTTSASGTKMAGFSNSSPPPSSSSAARSGGGGGGGGGVGPWAWAKEGNAATDAVAKGIASIDARVDRNRAYSLEADRISVLYQQMTGMSQTQVQQNIRTPLMNYRLGRGGANTLLDLQSRTGMSAMQQAGGIESVRAMTGYSLSTGGAASMLENLASPEVANRMFLLGGGGLVGPGGTQKNLNEVIQGLVKTHGLTDERLVDSAFAPGSITRSRMAQFGVAPELQDITLQYARQNLQYQKSGGEGMYDPGKEDHRRRMGIEENFATQFEETERLRDVREEKFYGRQADNFSDLEQQTQKLVKVFTELEDRLSGVIGFRTSNRVAMNVVGGAFNLVGLGGIGRMLTGQGPSGDSPDSSHTPNSVGKSGGIDLSKARDSSRDSEIKVPTWNGARTLNEVKNFSSFKSMHPKMQERILMMMRVNPSVGFGEGGRNYESQKAMFLDRYRRTNKKTNKYWDGSYWEHVKGAAAAVPGRSMHGVGLAADLTGDTSWVVENAHHFGLSHFANVNNEPWHVQPDELPAGFTQYVEQGAAWGLGGAGPEILQEQAAAGATPDGSTPYATPTSSESTAGEEQSGMFDSYFNSTSISQRVSSGLSNMGFSFSDEQSSAITSTFMRSAGAMRGEDVARLLHGEGFRGQDLIKMLAIGYRESRWVPSAHNPNQNTGDNSYGLFQLNTLGDLWDYYKQQGISDRSELLNPRTNARMARKLFEDSKRWNNGNGFHPWGDYANSGPGSSDGGLNISAAAEIVNSLDLNRGDPPVDRAPTFLPERSSSGSTTFLQPTNINEGHTFHINPTIQVMGNGSNMDLDGIARQVAALIKRELEMQGMRSS